jgi:hypothetical protein
MLNNMLERARAGVKSQATGALKNSVMTATQRGLQNPPDNTLARVLGLIYTPRPTGYKKGWLYHNSDHKG